MYEIKESTTMSLYEKGSSFSRDIKTPNLDMSVEAIARDGQSYIAISCEHGKVFFSPIMGEHGKVIGIEIACHDEESRMSLADALDFAQTALTDD